MRMLGESLGNGRDIGSGDNGVSHPGRIVGDTRFGRDWSRAWHELGDRRGLRSRVDGRDRSGSRGCDWRRWLDAATRALDNTGTA